MKRRFRVPLPDQCWTLEARGPVDPAPRDAEVAVRALDESLTTLAELDRALGTDGWCIVWSAPDYFHGSMVSRRVLIARSEQGGELGKAIEAVLEEHRFVVSRPKVLRSGAPDPHDRLLYVRSGSRAIGLDGWLGPLHRLVDVVAEPRDDVDFDLRFSLERQACPSCGRVVQPMEIVYGFPGSELMLASLLGEVELGGCTFDSMPPPDARCPRCGATFSGRFRPGPRDRG